MKCPQCGQWNRASLPHCIKCGAPLEADGGEIPSWKTTLRDDQKGKEYIRIDESGEASSTPDSRDALAEEMAELKQRKAAGSRAQRQLRRESAQRGSAPSGMTIRTHASVDTFWNMEDDPRSTVRVRRRTAAQTEPDPQKDNEAWQDTRSYDPLWEQQEMYGAWQLPQTTQFTGKLPSRARGLRHMIRILVIVLILCLVGLTGFFGYSYFKGRADAAKEQNKPSITASIKDDLAAHTILIPGTDGQQIYIKELHTSYIVTGGFATVQVADHTWYDEMTDYVGETMDVTLTPYVKTTGGQQKPMDLITYQITIPLSPITLNTPDGLRTEVSTAMYSLNFTVRPGSTVYINDENVSYTVDSEDGDFTYNATVQPIGDNDFVVRVRSQYCRENTLTVTLYREPQEIPLDLSADTYTSTSSKAIEIRATTLPGAEVEILSPHTDLNITQLETTGAFSFYALFDHYGDNTITITSSYPGKKTSTVEYTIYYIPSADEYTPKAWPLDASGYSELLANNVVRTERSQIYLVQGTIAEIVSVKPQMAIVYTGEDGKSQPVLVENFSKTTWELGEFYRLYADANGTYSSMPRLSARYTYP